MSLDKRTRRQHINRLRKNVRQARMRMLLIGQAIWYWKNEHRRLNEQRGKWIAEIELQTKRTPEKSK